MRLQIGTAKYDTIKRSWFTFDDYLFADIFGYRAGQTQELVYSKCLINELLEVNQKLLQIIKDNL